jgi:hypothetical protein
MITSENVWQRLWRLLFGTAGVLCFILGLVHWGNAFYMGFYFSLAAISIVLSVEHDASN